MGIEKREWCLIEWKGTQSKSAASKSRESMVPLRSEVMKMKSAARRQSRDIEGRVNKGVIMSYVFNFQ